MEKNIDKLLKEKNKILSFSDSEFLSFLYSERERYKDKDSKQGWTVWALACSLFAIACFIYELWKSSNGVVNSHLCYYIICTFLPFVLLCTYNIEKINALSNGDSRHIEMLHNIAPIRLLIFLSIVDVTLAIAGWLLEAKTLAVLNIISFTPVFISGCVMLYQRERFVTTRDRFVISSNSTLNFVLHIIVAGTIMLPISFANSHLTVGFSTEFELCVAIIVGVVLLYILLKIILSDSIENQIHEIIDGYLYRNRNKDESFHKMEQAVLGKRPTYVLQQLIDKLKESEKKISSEREKFKDLKEELSNGDFSLEKYNQLSDNFIENCKIIQDFSKTYDYVLLRSRELVNIKHLVPDEGFLEKNEEFINSDTLRCSINSAIYFKNEMTIFLQEYLKKAGCELL